MSSFKLHNSLRNEEVDTFRDLTIDGVFHIKNSFEMPPGQSLTGPTGPTGPRFTISHVAPSVATLPSSAQEGDFAMINSNVQTTDNGKLFHYVGGVWTFMEDFSGFKGLRGHTGYIGQDGPTGPQGNQGPTGETWLPENITEVIPNLGINNTNPQHSLDIGGDLNVTSLTQNGNPLTLTNFAETDIDSPPQEYLKWSGTLWQPSPFKIVMFSGKNTVQKLNYAANKNIVLGRNASSGGPAAGQLFTNTDGGAYAGYPVSSPDWTSHITYNNTDGLFFNNFGRDIVVQLSFTARFSRYVTAADPSYRGPFNGLRFYISSFTDYNETQTLDYNDLSAYGGGKNAINDFAATPSNTYVLKLYIHRSTSIHVPNGKGFTAIVWSASGCDLEETSLSFIAMG